MSNNPALRKDPTEALLSPSTFKNDDIQMDLELLALVTSSVGNNGSTLTLHTNQIAALQASDSTQNTNITSLQGSVATLNDDVAALNTELLGKADEADLVALEGRVDSAETNIADLDTGLLLKQNLTEKNQANGYAGLDSSAKIADTQINRAGPDEGFWKGDTINVASSRENNFVVYDSVDNKLKPLTSTVVPAYWYPGAVADAIGALQSGKVSWSPDYDNGLARITANETAIATINTVDLPAKQSTSQKNAANGYAGLNASTQVAAAQLPLASNVTRGALSLANVCRLGIDGADWSPGTASGTISVWKVLTDTFYNFNNAYGAGFKGTTNKTFFKAARDSLVSVKGNLAFSVATATTNKFFTLRITPVDPARTPTPHQYNYGLINSTTGSQSYSFAVDIPLRVGDSLSMEWNFTLGGTANPTFQKDYTYLHITDTGVSSNDWFP